MANLYNATPNNHYASSSSPHQEPDEISLFLQQILLRSSSCSSSSPFMTSDHLPAEKQEPEIGRISLPGTSPGLNSSSICSFAVANMSSSSVGNLDNEQDECDYESEEAAEALVEETAPKPTPARSSSKRSRAAEVHNLSEKRRRSRINEKMKALQNLIPNSNKTDKASMLDEAIEYLKQLQLQVQMLTMRNGLSLYPICLPGMLQPSQLSQVRTDVYNTDKFSNVNMTKALCMDQNISADELLGLQETCVNQAPVADFPSMIGSKSSLEVESSMQQHHFGAFQLSRSSKGICQEKVLPQPLIKDCPQGSSAGTKGASSTPFETHTSNLKENILEVCQAGGDHLLPSFVNNPVFSSQLNM